MPGRSHRRRSTLLVVSLAVAALAAQAGASRAAPESSARRVPIVFGHGQVVDAQRLAGEPQIHISGQDKPYITGPIGTQYATSFLWKSEDGGDSFDLLRAFPPLQRPNPALGTGDNDFAFLPPVEGQSEDALVWTDMVSLAGLQSVASFDGGNTFPPEYWNEFASGVGADRQWNASIHIPGTDTNRVYTFYDQVGGGALSVIYSDDYGRTWVDGERNIGEANPGNMAADPVRQQLYLAWAEGPNVMVAHGGLDASSFTPVTVAQAAGSADNLFVILDVDTAGNVYVTWTDGDAPYAVHLSASTDGGQTWSAPVQVNTPDLRTNVFPWVVAGDPGRVWVVWYGSRTEGAAPDNRGPWNVQGALSLNALDADSTWRQVTISEHPNHDNEICLSGIGCTAGQGEDRNMLDDLTADIDARGMLHVAYNDTNNQVGETTDPDAGGAFVVHAAQLAGPSLYDAVGAVTAPPPAGSFSVDPAGDARDPRHGPGCPDACPNNPVLDLVGAGLRQSADGSLTAVLRLNELPATPQEASIAAGRVVNYQLFFWVDGHVYFAALEADGPGLAYAGSPGNIPNQSGIAKIATYQPNPVSTTPTSFTWTPGSGGTARITIEIPTSVTGALARGTRIDQISGRVYTLVGPPGAELLMDERDASPAVSWRVGRRWTRTGAP